MLIEGDWGGTVGGIQGGWDGGAGSLSVTQQGLDRNSAASSPSSMALIKASNQVALQGDKCQC